MGSYGSGLHRADPLPAQGRPLRPLRSVARCLCCPQQAAGQSRHDYRVFGRQTVQRRGECFVAHEALPDVVLSQSRIAGEGQNLTNPARHRRRVHDPDFLAGALVLGRCGVLEPVLRDVLDQREVWVDDDSREPPRPSGQVLHADSRRSLDTVRFGRVVQGKCASRGLGGLRTHLDLQESDRGGPTEVGLPERTVGGRS